MQYLRILFSSFGEEDFQRLALNLLCSNCLSLLFRQQCRWHYHLNKLCLHTPKDYLYVIYLRILLSSFGEEDFKGLVNRNQIFSFYNFQSSAKMPVGEFHYNFNKL